MGFQTVHKDADREESVGNFNDPSSNLQIMVTVESASLVARRMARAMSKLSKDSSRPSVSSSQTGAVTKPVAKRPVVNEGDASTLKMCKIFVRETE